MLPAATRSNMVFNSQILFLQVVVVGNCNLIINIRVTEQSIAR